MYESLLKKESMITVKLVTNLLLDRKCDAYVFPVEHGFDFATLRSTAGALYAHYDSAAKERGFTGKAGSSLVLTGIHNKQGTYLIFLGLGDLKEGYANVETYRRAMGQLVRIAESHKLETVTFDLPDPAILGLSYERLAQETTTIMHKASYHFDRYITSPERKFTWNINVLVGVNKKYLAEAQDGLDMGIALGDAINTARMWCDMPPSALTPPVFAQEAKKIAQDFGLQATIFDRAALIKMGMGGIEGVGRGSQHEPRLVILEYKAPNPKAPTIALVGKGITFDSGGLSIKPSTAMETMKDDMAGAAVVLATMKVLAQFKPAVNVIGLAPMAENMPSGTAHKPGDVIRFYNGKTAEVKDTDAEGRLVLADALSYAVEKYKPNAIIDIATLTGSCAAALGPFYAGLLSQHDELTNKVIKASERSGDRVWRLPMDEDYKVAIRSNIADMSNIGTMQIKAGVITAAFFLQYFVGKVPWVHLDVAGTAFGVPDITYLRPGATGFGIRLFVDLIMNWEPDAGISAAGKAIVGIKKEAIAPQAAVKKSAPKKRAGAAPKAARKKAPVKKAPVKKVTKSSAKKKAAAKPANKKLKQTTKRGAHKRAEKRAAKSSTPAIKVRRRKSNR